MHQVLDYVSLTYGSFLHKWIYEQTIRLHLLHFENDTFTKFADLKISELWHFCKSHANCSNVTV